MQTPSITSPNNTQDRPEGYSAVLFEDDHLLVVNKPAGLNTHSPHPYGGEGIYEWLRSREPRWAELAIIHRLDKETSGLMVFSKTKLANRSLTEQFSQHRIRKRYLFVTNKKLPSDEITVVTTLVRAGEKYVSRPLHRGGTRAETRFKLIGRVAGGWLVEAQPITGRTHQIRVHASDRGFPVLGDILYGGAPFHRLCLHAEELRLSNPATDAEISFRSPAEFLLDPHIALRNALINQNATNAYRLIHAASDGWPGWYVDRVGDYFLSVAEKPLSDGQRAAISQWQKSLAVSGIYHKTLDRHISKAPQTESSPEWFAGDKAIDPFFVIENGLRFELSFSRGYSVGIFLDQRENRRRLLRNYIAPRFSVFDSNNSPTGLQVLNAFAYTCAFSICAAKSGARTASLDLSKNYLEWGKRNFVLNGVEPSEHEFISGDAFEWFRRWTTKGRKFDVVLLDPPTFSRSRESGLFQAEKNYGKLVAAALPLVRPGGVLFASTNAAKLKPENFVETIRQTIEIAGRKIVQSHYAPQPPDFPISRAEPAYFKTYWSRIE